MISVKISLMSGITAFLCFLSLLRLSWRLVLYLSCYPETEILHYLFEAKCPLISCDVMQLEALWQLCKLDLAWIFDDRHCRYGFTYKVQPMWIARSGIMSS